MESLTIYKESAENIENAEEFEKEKLNIHGLRAERFF